MSVPYWAQDAIFYQIFPDRFYNGDKKNDPPNVQPWGSPPTIHGFQGGDLRGIIYKLNYLLDLGITAIYLNPIFLSPSNHRYSTTDYFKIDPRLGDMHDFYALIDAAHTNQIRIILDGVFNHCSRGFFAFNDVLENQQESAYKDWFQINHFPVDAYSTDEIKPYQAWWGYKSLPKFNTNNPSTRKYIMDVARYWIEQGADGWRLDVPNEIDDDEFWAEFRENVKAANREAYLLGEIWISDTRWVGQNHFDGLMNYPIRDALLEFLDGTSSASGFANRIEQLLRLYPQENTVAMYNLLGSHDTERIRSRLSADLNMVKTAFSFLFAYPGIPSVYYGDETGLTGGKDPECRAAFRWEAQLWQAELQAWVKNLIHTRKRNPALRRGDFISLFNDDRRRCIAFGRRLGDQSVLFAMNASPTPRYLHLPVGSLGWTDGRILQDLIGYGEFLVSGDTLAARLPAWGSIWIG
ncbi:MAG TPA: glycoside hydrolase family 13 protein [Anaerolineales bacterium]|nr:glycoside hydrolase family 13 protein [Anaerolineales bacterium]